MQMIIITIYGVKWYWISVWIAIDSRIADILWCRLYFLIYDNQLGAKADDAAILLL